MTTSALLTVIFAALLHALWNLLAKQAAAESPFVFLYTSTAALLFGPAVFVLYRDSIVSLNGAQLCALLASAVIHLLYALMLQRAYAVGDFSVVYPLARGTGPLLATIGAIILLGERPTAIALAGVAAVVTGVFLLAGGKALFHSSAVSGVGYGVLTGVLIAAYTLVDANAVSALFVPPLLLDFTNNVFRSAMLLPGALRNKTEVRATWSRCKFHIIGVAALSPVSYLLVLYVLRTTSVSYVAPTREISMLLAAVLGATILGEPNFQSRLIASLLIASGVAALAAG